MRVTEYLNANELEQWVAATETLRGLQEMAEQRAEDRYYSRLWLQREQLRELPEDFNL